MSSLLRTENGLTTDIFVVKCTGRGLVVKRPGVLSKVQMLNLVPLPISLEKRTEHWEKESVHRPAPVRNFSLPKRIGATEERFRWQIYDFPGFYRVLVSTTGLESFAFL